MTLRLFSIPEDEQNYGVEDKINDDDDENLRWYDSLFFTWWFEKGSHRDIINTTTDSCFPEKKRRLATEAFGFAQFQIQISFDRKLYICHAKDWYFSQIGNVFVIRRALQISHSQFP